MPEAGAIVVKAIQAIATAVQAEKQEQLRQDRQDSRKDVSAETWVEELRDAAPEVDAGTCVTQWRGEDCDYGMVVEGLLRRDEGGRLRGDVCGEWHHLSPHIVR